MPLTYTKHEPISLRKHPDFSEVWLHDRIAADTTILGLGELDVIERERVQYAGGRLDMLLGDTEEGVRYEVEIMLGATDPSHIIRTIEYWDIERKRYPAYEHVAVLVAEEVTSRFLNVISLFSGSLPIVAIQLNALKIGDQVILSFVKVLDLRQQLREEDVNEAAGSDADRGTWDAKVGAPLMQICDRVAQFANEVADPKLELKYKKGRVGLCIPGQVHNLVVFFPKKQFMVIRTPLAEVEPWRQKCEEADLDVTVQKGDRLKLRVTADAFTQHEPLIREIVQQAIKEQQE
jgi:hypothetical protein